MSLEVLEANGHYIPWPDDRQDRASMLFFDELCREVLGFGWVSTKNDGELRGPASQHGVVLVFGEDEWPSKYRLCVIDLICQPTRRTWQKIGRAFCFPVLNAAVAVIASIDGRHWRLAAEVLRICPRPGIGVPIVGDPLPDGDRPIYGIRLACSEEEALFSSDDALEALRHGEEIK